MITSFSDLTEAERGVLVGAAREEAADQVGVRRARWHEIAEAIENGGKQPHSFAPGGYRQLAQHSDLCRVMETRWCPPSYGAAGCGTRPCARFESDDETPWLDDAGTGGPC